MVRALLTKMGPTLVQLHHKLMELPAPNLRGERHVEYSWIAANLPPGPGNALDFASGPEWMGLLAARRGYEVTAFDLQRFDWFYVHPSLTFLQGDILKTNLPTEHFDLIINCSAIEHIGLAGRYGVSRGTEDGDLFAMRILRKSLKIGKTMLLSVPVGRDHVFRPLHRVYGEARLPRLLDGWNIDTREYWTKDSKNRWICVDEAHALHKEAIDRCYGLGLFTLHRP